MEPGALAEDCDEGWVNTGVDLGHCHLVMLLGTVHPRRPALTYTCLRIIGLLA
jgi:hypothetical protein